MTRSCCCFGALAGIAAFLLGMIFIRPTFERIGALGQQLAGAGGPPAAAQLDELKAVDRRFTALLTVDLVLVTTALVFMAVSRYLG